MIARSGLAIVAAGMLFLHALTARAETGQQAVSPALGAGSIGPFPATDFLVARGTCPDCPTIKQALWYFRDDAVAVPRPGIPVSSWSPRIAPPEDVRQWYARASRDDLLARPPLVWIGSPSLVTNARLEPKEGSLRLQNGTTVRFSITPKIPSNRSYYDAKTAAFFEGRPLRLRGHMVEQPAQDATFVARTIWPQDYAVDAARLERAPLVPGESLMGLVRRQADGESERYDARLLWERNPGQSRDWDNLSVLGVLLNGAQGDDDEAHGGHFAIVTGRYDRSGQMSDWIVNNFYNLDYFSEKGIVAAMVPMDNYQMDLNSGQSYYRPSYMVVALIRNDHAALAYQGAIQRVFNRFYRHDFLYDHAAANCAGISIDTLRALGWNVPKRGATSYLKAVAAYPYMAIKDMDLASGRKAFAYLKEEQTRLYPAVAFDAIGNDLLQLVGAAPGFQRIASPFEKRLADEVEAVLFVRIPQVPSGRRYGTFPVASLDEYLGRVPEDKSKWEIVPVDPRPFPKEFADGEALAGDGGGALLAGSAAILISIPIIVLWRLRRARMASSRGGVRQ